jgi:hypothetical protein
MVLMVWTSLAALRFYRLGGGTNEGAWTRVGAPIMAVAAITAVLAVTVANLHSLLGTEPGSPIVFVLPGMVLAAVLAGLVWGRAMRRRPAIFDRIGRGEPEPLAELEHHLTAVDV